MLALFLLKNLLSLGALGVGNTYSFTSFGFAVLQYGIRLLDTSAQRNIPEKFALFQKKK
jgi:hypothetical protein